MEKNSLIMKNSVFENVVFDNHCGREYVKIEECNFINCAFHSSLGNGELRVDDSVFVGGVFKDLKLCGRHTDSAISGCKFVDCNFNNVDLKWDIGLYGTELNGGRVTSSCFIGQEIIQSRFSNMQIEDVDLRVIFTKNKMENVTFNQVVLTGYMGIENSDLENSFKNCKMEGFTFIEEKFGFDQFIYEGCTGYSIFNNL